ncbi:speckle-type POZ protein B-like [Planococcus citri]|uniref:speckle-type POZ protein B-like n=1 Tax=Planococcus citri TaxID=170843 RepID=UPI0031F89A5F
MSRPSLSSSTFSASNSDNISTLLDPRYPFKNIESSLSRDLGRIRIDEHYSDTTISVKGKNYAVHKVILAARSSVFHAMFKSRMQESKENHIIITDIDSDIFEEMLHYIYTGKANNLKVLAYELFSVADKYDLKHLKTICEQALIRNLSVDNAGKILTLADMHNAEILKVHTIQFIKRNAANGNCKDFRNTDLWKILSTSGPDLMRDMLAAFFE